MIQNGTVGNFIQETISVFEKFVKLDKNYIKAFKKLCGQNTCFEWEEPLVKIIDEQNTK